MTRTRTALAASAMAALVLVVGGCSGSADDDSSDSPTTSESGSTAGASTTPGADAAATLVDSGLQQLTAGDSAAARGTFENVLALDPDNIYALYNLGLIAQQADDAATAGDLYQRALTVQPDYVPALFNQAILTESTDLDAAITTYRKITTLDPTMASAFMRLGFAEVHQGDRKQGQADLATAVGLDPSLASVESPTYD